MVKQIAPPKVTGGGGFVFEDKVAAYVLAYLLSGQPPLDPSLELLSRVDFQTRVDGGWRSHKERLRRQATSFNAFKMLLKTLADFQNSVALEIQQRVVSVGDGPV